MNRFEFAAEKDQSPYRSVDGHELRKPLRCQQIIISLAKVFDCEGHEIAGQVFHVSKDFSNNSKPPHVGFTLGCI
ncbi:hypothetical protein A5784_04875 [Mycobacterium sp. 852013-50091_SCH5140682]|nr:hypothetical protein A5784_04875 [Mycobacterium sp. 852013-50091_SCH5140682]